MEEMSGEERIHVTRSRAKPGGGDVEVEGAVPFRSRKPSWLKVPPPGGPTFRRLKAMVGDEGLHTVCEEANCPNIGECWERGTATFMILGDVCTRRCGFCNVQTGKPTFDDPLESAKVANQVRKLGLRHAVITSVDRDDLHACTELISRYAGIGVTDASMLVLADRLGIDRVLTLDRRHFEVARTPLGRALAIVP